jgi:hypothetical protein
VTVVDRGRAKYVAARRDFAWAPALAEMLDRTVGVTAALERHFANVQDLESAWVFGSWAARRHGTLGPPPRDLDVLLVGGPSAIAVQRAAMEVEDDTGLRVDVTVVRPEAWREPGPDAVLQGIKAGPLDQLDLGGSDE